jgi:hypothetical protein
MAIITPSKSFQGSDLGSSFGSYIKSDIRQVKFNKDSNKDGAWLYILPPYKVDNSGNGVWYKVIDIRLDFGDATKERYYVPNRDTDPGQYFFNNLKRLYPEEAKVVEGEKGRKIYPRVGRITRRVLYNVVYVSNFEAGVHVLDFPAYYCAEQIDKYNKVKNADGTEREPICSHTKCIPIWVKLNENVVGNPWEVSPDPAQAKPLPDEFADPDMGYLYDLDTVLVDKPEQEIIDKLKLLYPDEVYESCMRGFKGFKSERTAPAEASESSTVVVSPATRAISMPAAPKATAVAPAIPKAHVHKQAASSEAVAPVGPSTAVTKEEAMAILTSKRKPA